MIPIRKLRVTFSYREKKFKKYHLYFNDVKQPFNTLSAKFAGQRYGYKIVAQKRCLFTEKQLLNYLKLFKKNLRILSTFVKVNSYFFPNFYCTRKPKDIRMGRGKGVPSLRVMDVKEGQCLFEIYNILPLNLSSIMGILQKFPIKVAVLSL